MIDGYIKIYMYCVTVIPILKYAVQDDDDVLSSNDLFCLFSQYIGVKRKTVKL